jgi:hypothetical protein
MPGTARPMASGCSSKIRLEDMPRFLDKPRQPLAILPRLSQLGSEFLRVSQRRPILASVRPSFWLQLLSAVLAGVVGLLLLSQPIEGVLVLSLLLIVFLTSSGMARVVFALTIRPLPSWGWLLLSGIAGILMGFVLWSLLPGVADWLVGVLLGTHFIVQHWPPSRLRCIVRLDDRCRDVCAGQTGC